MRRFFPALLALALCGVAVRGAPQAVDPATVPGSWKPFRPVTDSIPAYAPPWLTRAHVRALLENLDRVTDVFRKAPPLDAPIGFLVWPKRTVAFNARPWTAATPNDPRWIVPGSVMLSAVPYEMDERTRKPEAPEYGGQALVFTIDVNQLNCVLGNSDLARDAEGLMYFEPAPVGQVHGFPQFGRCVAVTRRTAPVFAPVSQERWLSYWIGKAEADLVRTRQTLAVLPKDGGAVVQQVEAAAVFLEGQIANLRGQLAAMSGAERRAPAYAIESVDPRRPLAAQADEGARRVVQPNHDFFDPARPTDPQFIGVYIDCDGEWCQRYLPLIDRLRDSLDWNALAALTR